MTHWDRDYLTDEQLRELSDNPDAESSAGAGPQGETHDADLRAPEPAHIPDWRLPGIAAVIVAGATLLVWLLTIGPLG